MVDGGHLRLLEAVAAAARAYREAIRRSIRNQTDLLDQGVLIEEVTDRITGGFGAVAEAEDALDDALVVLEWFEASARSDERRDL